MSRECFQSGHEVYWPLAVMDISMKELNGIESHGANPKGFAENDDPYPEYV
jgi:hypothetical protein